MSNGIIEKIFELAEGKKNLRFMEVCGTHTVSIFRAGIRQILPKNIELVSGPGCPVCVTDDSYIDKAIEYAKKSEIIIATFGDMLKVPGSRSNLAEISAEGADVRIIYSPMDCLKIAAENPDKKIIFLAVGFETTAPTAAAAILSAKNSGLKNLFFLSAQKLVPPALKMLLNDSAVKVDGFLLPGHVAVVTGTKIFDFLANDYKIPSVVSGFEAEEILLAILNLLKQIDEKKFFVANEYKSVVKSEGNIAAQKILYEVYEKVDADWRGLGKIKNSGLKVRKNFSEFDIENILPVEVEKITKKTPCRCGEVLRGIIQPLECPLFGKSCQPLHAVGPCMVSVEGVCAAWYKYGAETFSF
ncbi:MAG: hydrogenase formation protein HypD [Selenomonadaceae bacterium]|nr:hydrogenase formation protein HypD [Selenomonadaceae bacterium]